MPRRSAPPASPRRARARGFTIVELLTVLTMVAIVAAFAAPSFQSLIIAQRLRASGTDLVSSLLLARSEAIKRNANVTVRPATANNWTSGWLVAADDGTQLDRKTELGNRVAVTRAPATIVYNPSGRLVAAGAARVQFADSYAEPGIAPRCVSIDTSGVPKLTASTCP